MHIAHRAVYSTITYMKYVIRLSVLNFEHLKSPKKKFVHTLAIYKLKANCQAIKIFTYTTKKFQIEKMQSIVCTLHAIVMIHSQTLTHT